MGIRIVHQPSPGVMGIAAYESGLGKARERKRKDFLNLYRDEQQRRERREAQFRGFSYHAALEGMRQRAIGERAEQEREWDIEDVGQQREWDIEDAERQRQQAIEDRKAGEAHDLARDDRRWQGYRDRDAAQVEMGIDADIREKLRSGELELGPGAQQALNEADKIEAEANKPENGLTDAEKSEAKATADKMRRDAWRMAKPSAKPSKEDRFKQNTHVDDDGTTWVERADGTWTVGKEGPGAARSARIRSRAKDLYNPDDPEGDYRTIPEAIAAAEKEEDEWERGLAPRGELTPLGDTEGRSVPAPPLTSPTGPDGRQGGGQRIRYDLKTGDMVVPSPPGQPKDSRGLPGGGLAMTPNHPDYVPPPPGQPKDSRGLPGGGLAMTPEHPNYVPLPPGTPKDSRGLPGGGLAMTPAHPDYVPPDDSSGLYDKPILDISDIGTVAEEQAMAEDLEALMKAIGSASEAGSGTASNQRGVRRRRGESDAAANQRYDKYQVVNALKQKVRDGGKLTPEEVATLRQLRQSLKRKSR